MISPFWLEPKSESEAGPMIFDFEILSMFPRPSADMWLTRDLVSRDIASWQYLVCNTRHLEGIITLIPLSLWFTIQKCRGSKFKQNSVLLRIPVKLELSYSFLTEILLWSYLHNLTVYLACILHHLRLFNKGVHGNFYIQFVTICNTWNNALRL